jgi:ribonuclease HI
MRGIANFIVLILPNNIVYKTSVCLEYPCTNSQAECEALQFGLQNLVDMGVKNIDAYGDLLLVVQKIIGEFWCFD